MKKAILILLLPLCFHAKAQSDEENKDVKKGFQKERLFTGGNVNLGFSSYYTSLGITPQFGYSLTDWADAGITINLNYTSQKDQFQRLKSGKQFMGRVLLLGYSP